jgi:hypothetical protein
MITDQHRKQVQSLMEQPQWAGFEAFFDDFMKKNFIQASIKRENEFETIWYAAEFEGGKRMLQDFKSQLEAEAKQV